MSARSAAQVLDESALIVNVSATMAYSSLRCWLNAHEQVSRVDVLTLRQLASPGEQAPRALPAAAVVGPWEVVRRLGRYRTILVLCVSDEQVSTGHAPFRIVGELLFSKRLLLVGPQLVKEWPSGRNLLDPPRAREVASLAGLGLLSVATSVMTLIIVALDDLIDGLREGISGRR